MYKVYLYLSIIYLYIIYHLSKIFHYSSQLLKDIHENFLRKQLSISVLSQQGAVSIIKIRRNLNKLSFLSSLLNSSENKPVKTNHFDISLLVVL